MSEMIARPAAAAEEVVRVDALDFSDGTTAPAVFAEGGGPVLLDAGQDATVLDGGEGFAVRRVGLGFVNPLYVAAVPDGTGRVFVLEKGGAIKILDPATGQVAADPFLDLRGAIGIKAEQGLLGFAAAPDYETSGTFYVYVSTPEGPNEVRRYSRSDGNPDMADPASMELVYRTTHGADGFHNGGWIGFDSTGLLYVAVGDGNDAAPGFTNAQNLETSLGKILRLDVGGDDFPDDATRNFAVPEGNPYAEGGGLPEIFVSGMRNPYRASFDAVTGKLYVADVGQGVKEEVNVIGPEDAGKNYGWPWFEGTSPYGFGGDPDDYQMPDIEYGHGFGAYQGNSVTGGYVYRGSIASLEGEYIFGDFISRNIWSVTADELTGDQVVTGSGLDVRRANFRPDAGTINLISSFGEDEARNLYIVDYADGEVYRLEEGPEANFAGGTLRASVGGGSPDADRLSFKLDGGVALSAGLTVGSIVSVGGVAIGAILPGGTGSGGDDLLVSFGGAATADRVQTLTRAIAYANVAEGATGTREVTVTLHDGDVGADHRRALAYAVTIAAENDAPSFAGLNGTPVFVEDAGGIRLAPDAAVADPELDRGSYAGAVLTLERDGAGAGDDLYGFAGAASLSGSDLLVDGMVVARVAEFRSRLVVTFGDAATPAAARAVLRAVTYTNVNDTPPASVTILYAFSDGNTGAQGSGTALAAAGSVTVSITPTDDPAALRDDAFGVDETGLLGDGLELFGDNGSGIDADVDGPALAVTAVNGVAADLGRSVVLASGATLRVEADGTFRYDPNGAFDGLAAADSGASNAVGTDRFTYTAGGATATATITVRGVASPGDELIGTGGDDVIRGSAIADLFRLEGGGTDRAAGGDADDRFLMGSGLDSADRIDGGAGDDRVELAGDTTASLGGGRFVGVESLTLRDGPSGAAASYRLTADDTLVATGGLFTLTVAGIGATVLFDGSAERDGRFVLTGGRGDDRLIGGSGADLLAGGLGDDRLAGGSGDDIYGVDGGDTVEEASGSGYDTVYADESFALAAGAAVEVLSTSGWNALAAIDLTGNEGANRLFGNAGTNRLDGGAGADVMTGFGGDDVYLVDDRLDRVVEGIGGGDDVVETRIGWALAADAEIETLRAADRAGTAAIDLTGNGFANRLGGNAGANTLAGGGGADMLLGYGGNDVYGVDDAGDLVIEAARGGYDTVYAGTSWTLGANQEVEVLSTSSWTRTAAIDLTGNGFANRLFGNAGANFLDGGGGADAMTGFGGNDFYAVDHADDLVLEAAGGGYDTVYASADWTLAEGAAVEVVSAANWRGTDALSLTGNSLGNALFGNAGANSLNGRGGSDTLTGFGGADRFVFASTLGVGNVDRVTDFEGGVDKLVLARAVFAALGAGPLAAGAFHRGAAAADADDRILYDPTDGSLYYDADGTGSAAAAAVRFAVLQPDLDLSAADFVLL